MVAGLRGERLDSVEQRMRARLHLYSPGGQLAVELAKNPTVLVVNDTLFAHGGVLPKHGARAARMHRPNFSRLHPLRLRASCWSRIVQSFMQEAGWCLMCVESH